MDESINTPEIVLSLDLSTTCTGWSIFSLTGDLLNYGTIKPNKKAVAKLEYPQKQLRICIEIAESISTLINVQLKKFKIKYIVIEEINRHMNRLAGKTIDVLHGMVWLVNESFITKMRYVDSDGFDGWRSRNGLGLLLSDADKQFNKEAKMLNKKMARGTPKIEVRTKKHLACDFVNRTYGTNFNVDLNPDDNDICDSIGLGHFFIHKFKHL